MNAEQTHQFNLAASTYLEHACLQTQINQHLQNLIPELEQGALVLDCGAHSHDLSPQLPNQNIISLDSAFEALSHNQNPNCLNADFSKLPFADNTFDLIFSSMALHWSEDINATLNHWSHLLKPTGQIALAIPVEGSCHELFDAMGRTPFQFHNVDQIQQLCHDQLGQVNFEIKTFTAHFDSLFALLRYFQQTGCQVKSKGLFKLDKLQSRYDTVNNFYPLSFKVAFMQV